jgi:hypothetical protein
VEALISNTHITKKKKEEEDRSWEAERATPLKIMP